jgi:membrane peptidoglycan carboxypeptidase
MADCRGKPLHGFRYPYRGYADFAAVPPRVAQALMFIENRDLLDESRPQMNPAVDWVRFARAVLGRVGHLVSSDFDAPGGSTLATQIEKFRHSRDGVTYSGSEKLRQMASASVRAYQDGEETLPARRRLLLDYLNTVPLSARPGMARSMASATACGCGSRPISTPPTSCSPRPKPAARTWPPRAARCTRWWR